MAGDSSAPVEPSPATFWRRKARRTVLRYNAGCMLSGFLPLYLGTSAVFACALLVVRENGGGWNAAWAVYGAALLLGLVAAFARARGRFFSVNDALTRLDWHLGLHNRLSAAAAGVGEFPDPRVGAEDGYAFRAPTIALPLAGAALLVFLAATVPLTRHAAALAPTVAPVAWTQTAQWVDALQKAALVQTPSLEELKERLEELRKQPAQDWYSQSSLEAGDSLRDQTAKSLEALQRDLKNALSNLDALQRAADGSSAAADTKEARDKLAQALQGLEMGNLPLNRDLLDGLKNADLAHAKVLTPEQAKALKERLKEGAQVCQACLGPGEKPGDGVLAAAMPGQPREPGPGGGPGAPLSYNEKPVDLGTTETGAVSNDNMEHALPGDLMGVGKGEHEVDPSKYTGPTSAGAISSNGQGGEAVGRNDLTPKERTVLKNFFK